MSDNLMDKVVALCKRRGFIFQSSGIYGGLANTWDYGPYGTELKNNVKGAWWRSVVHQRDDILGMDAAILMHPKVWEASGHTQSFSDSVVDCKSCKKRFRVDLLEHISGDEYRCPECKSPINVKDTPPRQFNLMLKTYLGSVQDASSLTYLRPETAQGIFTNFLNIIDSRHPKLPFGIAQIGKSFRNEVTPGNFTFRTREFEQMEIEYFIPPQDAEESYKNWVSERFKWYTDLGINKKNIRKRQHAKDELAHYAKACTDIEYNFPFGWSELEGIANRTDYDLRCHSKVSGKELKFFDVAKKESYYPYIIEPSGGIDRSVLAFLVDAYFEEKVKNDLRVVLKLHADLAPVKLAVLPLLKKNPQLVATAKKLAKDLKKSFVTVYDDTAAIGKLYRRQDEVGTLYCITVDVESLKDKKVTVRDRDTMKQDRISLDKLKEYLLGKLGGGC